jgi:hypothetical protein
MAIEKKFLGHLTDVMYVALSMKQKWSNLLKEEDEVRVQRLNDSITLWIWLKSFVSRSSVLSDVVEISFM